MIGLRRARRAGAFLLCAAVGCALLAAAATPAAAEPKTVYRSSRPALTMKIVLRGRTLVHFDARGLIGCGHDTPRRAFIEAARLSTPIRDDGHFRIVSNVAEEGYGWYYSKLVGRVRGETLVGSYRESSRPSPEEDESAGWKARCGTVVPRGRTIHFVAHRVAGPLPPGGSGRRP